MKGDQSFLRELVSFAKDQIEVLGEKQGMLYVKGCLGMWRDAYGEAVANKVASEVRQWIVAERSRRRAE